MTETNWETYSQLVAGFSGNKNVVAVQRAFCEYADSLEGGLILSQIIFWSDKGSDPAGWVYKSYKDWKADYFVSTYTVKKWLKIFVGDGFLEMKVKKVNGSPTIHFKFDSEKFTKLLIKFFIKENEIIDNPLKTETSSENSSEEKRPAPKSAAAVPYRRDALDMMLDYSRDALERPDVSFLPEHLQPLAEQFSRSAGESHWPRKHDHSLWRKTLNEWYDLGLRRETIQAAVEVMRKDGLTIGGPQSITKTARDIPAAAAAYTPHPDQPWIKSDGSVDFTLYHLHNPEE